MCCRGGVRHGCGAPNCALKGCLGPRPSGRLQSHLDPLRTATIEGNGGSAGSAWSGDFHGEGGQVCHLEPHILVRVHSGGCWRSGGWEVGEVLQAGAGCRRVFLSHAQERRGVFRSSSGRFKDRGPDRVTPGLLARAGSSPPAAEEKKAPGRKPRTLGPRKVHAGLETRAHGWQGRVRPGNLTVPAASRPSFLYLRPDTAASPRAVEPARSKPRVAGVDLAPPARHASCPCGCAPCCAAAAWGLGPFQVRFLTCAEQVSSPRSHPKHPRRVRHARSVA